MDSVRMAQLWWDYSQAGEESWTLKGIDLAIKAGERVGLVGPSGCGKSTLVMTLNGIIPQSFAGRMAGKVVICGNDASTTPTSKLARSVAMVFQSPDNQITQILAADEVAFGLANQGLLREEVRARSKEVLCRLGLDHFADRETMTLSGGEKQKLMLAAAIAMEPKLLVLDEPTTDLDPRNKAEMIAMLSKLPSDVAVLLISHSLEVIAPLVDRLVVMDEGEIVADGSKNEVWQKSQVLTERGISLPEMVQFNLAMSTLVPDWEVDNDFEATTQRVRQWRVNRLEPVATVERKEAGEMVRLERVSFSYPDREEQAVKDLSVSFGAGEMVAVVGQNGAGKTTLANLILGLIRPNQGKVMIGGEEVSGVDPSKAGVVFQNPDLMLCCQTVEEEVAFAPRQLGLSEPEKRVQEILEAMGLEDLGEAFPPNLSRGQRQRVAYGAVLAAEPPVLIFDEPTTGVDHRSCLRMMRTMAKERDAGKAVIIITHDLPLACQWADRVVVMQAGRVAYDLKPSQLAMIDEEELNRLHLVLPTSISLARKLGAKGWVGEPEELAGLVARKEEK